MKRIPQKELRRTQPPARVIFAQIVLAAAAMVFQLFLNYRRYLEYLSHEQTLSIFGIFPMLTKHNKMRDIPVFYNVYVANQSNDLSHVSHFEIKRDQK
jgi:hypothetical protein